MIRADILAESIAADDGRPAWSREEFEAQLRENGKSYHIHHPFNVMLNTGHATPEQYTKEITVANDGIVNQATVHAYAKRRNYPVYPRSTFKEIV